MDSSHVASQHHLSWQNFKYSKQETQRVASGSYVCWTAEYWLIASFSLLISCSINSMQLGAIIYAVPVEGAKQ